MAYFGGVARIADATLLPNSPARITVRCHMNYRPSAAAMAEASPTKERPTWLHEKAGFSAAASLPLPPLSSIASLHNMMD